MLIIRIDNKRYRDTEKAVSLLNKIWTILTVQYKREMKKIVFFWKMQILIFRHFFAAMGTLGSSSSQLGSLSRYTLLHCWSTSEASSTWPVRSKSSQTLHGDSGFSGGNGAQPPGEVIILSNSGLVSGGLTGANARDSGARRLPEDPPEQTLRRDWPQPRRDCGLCQQIGGRHCREHTSLTSASTTQGSQALQWVSFFLQ